MEELTTQAAVYNIEVDGEHVYEVAGLGMLVHNGNVFDCQRYTELFMKKYGGEALTAAESRGSHILSPRVTIDSS